MAMEKQIHRSNTLWLSLAMVLIFLLAVPVWQGIAQSKKDLQNQRDDINTKIDQTKKMIRDSERQQKSTIRQVQLLNEQLAFREQVGTQSGTKALFSWGPLEGRL